MSDRDAEIAEVLAAHEGITFDLGTPREYTQYGGWNQSCACGEPLGDAGGDDGDERVATAHRAHLAAVLAERERRVKAEVLREAADDSRQIRESSVLKNPIKPFDHGYADGMRLVEGRIRDRADRIGGQ